MKTKPRLLTAEEWFSIRTCRGVAMTGQNAHRTDHVPIKGSLPTYVRGVGKTYYWCMGLQPDKTVIDKIARRCPVKAAAAFLAHFERNDPKAWPQNFVRPVQRKEST
jgi:hypothetical protein